MVNSNNVIGDHMWLWRADHGSGVGWTTNTADTGLVVNGDNVTMYGLFVEHYQKYQVIWNGNGGRTYFFQNEMPYDPPNQAAWMNGSTQGYAAYKVADSVTSHEAWGLGSYCYFNVNPSRGRRPRHRGAEHPGRALPRHGDGLPRRRRHHQPRHQHHRRPVQLHHQRGQSDPVPLAHQLRRRPPLLARGTAFHPLTQGASSPMSISRFLGRFAVFAVLAAVLTALLTVTPAHAAYGSITGLAGKCVDVAGASSANGTAVQLYDCNGTGAQIWSNPVTGPCGRSASAWTSSTAAPPTARRSSCGTAPAAPTSSGWSAARTTSSTRPRTSAWTSRGNNSANGTRLQIWTCSGGANQKWNAPASGGGGTPSGFVVSEAQFNQMFPSRNSFYTYSGLIAALSAYPGFANTGSDTVKKQEAAAFLANVNHETGGLVYIVEQNTANYPDYCDRSQSYGCPAGQAAYYGRGPIQLSWNFNYKAAGDALGIDLLNNPWLVQNDAGRGLEDRPLVLEHPERPRHHDPAQRHGQPGRLRPDDPLHQRLPGVRRQNPAQVQSRVDAYNRFTSILGVAAGQQPLLLTTAAQLNQESPCAS